MCSCLGVTWGQSISQLAIRFRFDVQHVCQLLGFAENIRSLPSDTKRTSRSRPIEEVPRKAHDASCHSVLGDPMSHHELVLPWKAGRLVCAVSVGCVIFHRTVSIVETWYGTPTFPGKTITPIQHVRARPEEFTQSVSRFLALGAWWGCHIKCTIALTAGDKARYRSGPPERSSTALYIQVAHEDGDGRFLPQTGDPVPRKTALEMRNSWASRRLRVNGVRCPLPIRASLAFHHGKNRFNFQPLSQERLHFFAIP